MRDYQTETPNERPGDNFHPASGCATRENIIMSFSRTGHIPLQNMLFPQKIKKFALTFGDWEFSCFSRRNEENAFFYARSAVFVASSMLLYY